MSKLLVSLLLSPAALALVVLPGTKATSKAVHRPPLHHPVAPEAGACPSDMELIGGAFCIDQYEATTAEIRDDGTIDPHSPFLPVGGLRVKALSVKSHRAAGVH